MFTYSGDPRSGSVVDQIRFLIQDTTSTTVSVQDEEILWVYDESGNIYYAAADCCDILAINLANNPESKTVGDLTITYGSDPAKGLALRANMLRRKAATKTVGFIAGGVSVARKTDVSDNTDRVSNRFIRDQFDNLSSASTST